MKGTMKYIIILAVVAGLTIEFMKNSAKHIDATPVQSLSAAAITQMDIRPYHNSDENMASENKGRKALGKWKRSRNRSSENFINKKTAAKKKAKKKKIAKKDKKKKEEEKKKKDGSKTTTDVAKNTSDFITDEPPKTDEVSASAPPLAGGNFVSNLPEEENSDLPIGYEEWADLILKRPNLVNTTKMIKHFQTNLVSAEIFYTILDEMITDPRKEMNELAIVAAGSTARYQSFLALIKIIESEPNGSSISVKARTRINEYESVGKVETLRSVLASPGSSDVAISTAVKALKASTDKNLSEVDANSNSGPNTQANLRYYTGFVGVLEGILSTFASNSSISGPAQDAYDKIKSLMLANQALAANISE